MSRICQRSPESPVTRSSTEIVGLGLLLALLAGRADTLVVSPILGMADNGDFWRVSTAAGLVSEVPVSAVRHRFIQPTYRRAAPLPDARFSSAGLLASMAAALPGGDADRFPLQRMGALLLGLAACLLAFGALRRGAALCCAGIAWVLTDPAYLLFFNSFYADSAALLGMVGVTAVLCGCGRDVDRGGLCVLVLCAFVAAWSKQAHVVLALVVAGALLAIGPLRRTLWGKATTLVCVGIFAASLQHFTFGSGHRFPQINNYNAVFVGIAQVASRPSEALSSLGLGSEHLDRIGIGYFQQPVAPELSSDLEGLSRAHLAWLYASDPIALGRVLQRAQQMLTLEDRFVGNHVYSPRHPAARVHDVPWAFSGLRQALLHFPAVFWIGWLGSGAAALRVARRNRWAAGPWVAVLFLWMTILAETAVAILGDGLFSLGRHLLIARFATDLLIVIALASALRGVVHSRHIAADAPDAIG